MKVVNGIQLSNEEHETVVNFVTLIDKIHRIVPNKAKETLAEYFIKQMDENLNIDHFHSFWDMGANKLKIAKNDKVKMVIDIPEEMYNRIVVVPRCSTPIDAYNDRATFVKAIRNGTVITEKESEE